MFFWKQWYLILQNVLKWHIMKLIVLWCLAQIIFSIRYCIKSNNIHILFEGNDPFFFWLFPNLLEIFHWNACFLCYHHNHSIILISYLRNVQSKNIWTASSTRKLFISTDVEQGAVSCLFFFPLFFKLAQD